VRVQEGRELGLGERDERPDRVLVLATVTLAGTTSPFSGSDTAADVA
jgi:hypothetical protein